MLLLIYYLIILKWAFRRWWAFICVWDLIPWMWWEKIVFKRVAAHSDWTSTKWKEEEMPGTLQSLTFNFFCLFKSTNICQFERSYFHLLLVFLSFLSFFPHFLLKLLCCACGLLFLGGQGVEVRWNCQTFVLSHCSYMYMCICVGAFRNSYLSGHCAKQHSSWRFFSYSWITFVVTIRCLHAILQGQANIL